MWACTAIINSRQSDGVIGLVHLEKDLPQISFKLLMFHRRIEGIVKVRLVSRRGGKFERFGTDEDVRIVARL